MGDCYARFPELPMMWRKGLKRGISSWLFSERRGEGAVWLKYHRFFDIMRRNGWSFLRGDDTHDYIRKEISEAYDKLTG